MVLLLDSQAKRLRYFFWRGRVNYFNFTTFLIPCGGHCSYSACLFYMYYGYFMKTKTATLRVLSIVGHIVVTLFFEGDMR